VRGDVFVLCVLCSLLVGLLFQQFARVGYEARCRIMVYRDPKLSLSEEPMAFGLSSHVQLVQSERVRGRAVDRLQDPWQKVMGSKERMLLPVRTETDEGYWGAPAFRISVRSSNRVYAEVFLQTLVEVHKAEWQAIEMEANATPAQRLREQLDRTEDKIRAAEDDVIEYRRLYDVARTQARVEAENTHVKALVERRAELSAELQLLDNRHPALKNGGSIAEPLELGEDHELHRLRAELTLLRREEERLKKVTQDAEPGLNACRGKMGRISSEIEILEETEKEKIRQRHAFLRSELEAIEQAEYKWQAKDLQASARQGELERIADVVERHEDHYRVLYWRLRGIVLSSELKADHFTVLDPVTVSRGRLDAGEARAVMIVAALVGVVVGLVVGTVAAAGTKGGR